MSDAAPARRKGLLDMIEWVGNKLPDPAFIFVFGAVLVMALSAIGHSAGWAVQPKMLRPVVETVLDNEGRPVLDAETGRPVTRPVLDEQSRPVLQLVDDLSRNDGRPFRTRNLLSADGLYYAISSMVDNFVNFPPLGVVLVGMLGIGLAERSGFIGAALKAMMVVVPKQLLTPTMIFLGIMSSLGTDAGYVVLPPVAAALYKSVGRSPLAGIAAVFAGVSAGFNANLLVTSLDPLLAGFSTAGAQVVDPGYAVAPTCNWWFMIASTIVITGVGWVTSDFLVEPRYARKAAAEGGPSPVTAEDAAAQRLRPEEIRGLFWAFGVLAAATLLFVCFKLIPGWPFDDARGRMGAIPGLSRAGDHFDRWVEAIVPLLFILFLLPGVVYGVVVGTVRNSGDAARLMVESMAGMAPIIVLAFFAAQFIEYFKYSNLDKMLAYTGGEFLAGANLSPAVLMVAFVLLTAVFNLFVGSMSAKYAMFAPIFVPMFMIIGVSPELTQAAYRIGDSTTNIITPLNAYLVIILVVMQKYAPKAGMGSLISMMLPYTVTFTIVWLVLLLLWMNAGFSLGPGGPLVYEVPH
ncbi:MAG: AbgT family transporter [Leptolyngbya sp. PLA2]|nr:AbgT family transporter [Leptolyngbya sp.]MCE7972479.1 AbgT family transporter [Leptolyngbya sp. PL-A2]MCQ3941138.1 AbgT family transporter [cyanobacterium CYA1]MCZ7633204.1 AbgT family transporter [Phycisphaerales bacterium]MDL1905422.1 AbgT family transporter [Synechococcales cyanobacterium CNB]GIK18318.1 MAG: aminobenzoyl-glutamate transporter [Planctomycetota bacterium]